jgi:uncharacterized protein DUF11
MRRVRRALTPLVALAAVLAAAPAGVASTRPAAGFANDTLVQPDTNFSQDVSVHEGATGSTVRASDAPGGVQGNKSSFGADVNGDGHFGVFSTFASNLGGNPDATVQVMLRDLDSGALTPISSQGDDVLDRSNDARITPDGRFIVWDDSSSNLLPRAIVRLDRTTNTREIEGVNDADQAGQRRQLASRPELGRPLRRVHLDGLQPRHRRQQRPSQPTRRSSLRSGATCSRAGKGRTEGTITCSVGSLAAGASTTVRILVQPVHTGTLTFAPRVYADQPDPNRANNAASVTTTVTK